LNTRTTRVSLVLATGLLDAIATSTTNATKDNNGYNNETSQPAISDLDFAGCVKVINLQKLVNTRLQVKEVVRP
jgi:hypothetical protein